MCYEYSKGPVQPFATKLQRDIILIIIIILRYCTGTRTWYQVLVSYRSRTWYLMQSCTGRFQTFYKMLRLPYAIGLWAFYLNLTSRSASPVTNAEVCFSLRAGVRKRSWCPGGPADGAFLGLVRSPLAAATNGTAL